MIRLTAEKLKNDGTNIDYEHLSFEQRLLLVNSGSMTFLLEELLNEELKLNKLYEAVIENDDSHIAPYMRGQKVLKRNITLQSVKTNVNHLYAESFILIDNLDSVFADLLLNSNTPIGKLWETKRIETYKVLDTWGGEKSQEHSKYFGTNVEDPLIFRTYFVFTGQKLTMKITEKFPQRWYRDSMVNHKSYRTVA